MDTSEATITAAGVGAAIALIGLVANKENKTSEFRQQWVDALRQDIASLIGILFAIKGGVEDSNKAAESLSMLNARIYLRFKYGDKESVALQLALQNAMKLELLKADDKTFKMAIDHLIDESQKLLKREWQVVKEGERTYRLLIRSLVFLLPILALIFVWHLLR